MGSIIQEQADWLKEFLGIDVGAEACTPGISPQAAGGTGAMAVGLAPIDSDGQLAAAFVTPAPQPGSGGSSHDGSDLTFTTGYGFFWTGSDPKATIVRPYEAFDKRTTVGFMVPGEGTLTLNLAVKGFQDNQWPHGNGSFTQDVSVTWKINSDAEGNLKIEQKSVEIGQHDGGTDYRLDSLNPSQGAKSVSISPIVVGTSDTDADGTWNVNVNLQGKKVGGGGGYTSGSSSKTTAAPKIQTSIAIDLNPVVTPKPKPPPTPDPKGTVEGPKQVQYVANFDYQIGPFKVGKVELESGSVTKSVYDIFHSLPDEAQNGLIQGKLAGEEWEDGSKTGAGTLIEIHGYASNTDTEDHNFDLSKKRAEAVLAAFQSLGVPATAFTKPIPHGEWETGDDSGMKPTDNKKEEKESAEWRKVVLKMKVVQVYVPL
jgi:OmpA family